MTKLLNIVVLSLACLCLQGCFETVPVKTDVVYVDKIVPVAAPQPPVIQRPTLEISKLTDAQKSDEGLVAKAYKATVKQLEGYSEQLEAIIEGYRIKP